MKALQPVTPTPEQLPLILNSKAGVKLIRGAAGSGKTTTAVLRLKQLAAAWLQRRSRMNLAEPVRILVITYNKTLRGYIRELAEQQLASRAHLDLAVQTFGKWSRDRLPDLSFDSNACDTRLSTLCARLRGQTDFLKKEAEYVMGRYLPESLADYLTASRIGRGNSPRVEQPLRQQLIDEVIQPYVEWKHNRPLHDWNDLAVSLATTPHLPFYDIIIADEAQDLSANQVRALMNHAAETSSVTFVLDAAQRIYPRGFTWREAGVTINAADSHRLAKNYRNTREIAAFALPLLQGLDVGDDGTIPDLTSCERNGDLPIVLQGRYAAQMTYAGTYLADHVDLATESVAFLHPAGGRWFSALESYLTQNSYEYVTLTRRSDWPQGATNIALSTMSSAKGLEFDHVIILGLNQELTPHGTDPDDTDLQHYRRLLAMAITRAKKNVVLGYKGSEASSLVGYLQRGTYQEVTL